MPFYKRCHWWSIGELTLRTAVADLKACLANMIFIVVILDKKQLLEWRERGILFANSR
jgi:hypothetical protein